MDRTTDKATIHLGGNEYVVLPRAEYDRLAGLAKAGALPQLPKPDAEGNYPAADFMRVSMARKLVAERARLAISQQDLAKHAGLRVETISRLETGKHVASTSTAQKIAKALKKLGRN